MHELRPWLRLIFRHRGRLVLGGVLILATLLSGIALLAVSGWFLTKTAIVGLLLAAGIQASINLYVPGGAIRFFAVSRTAFRYMERVYNHNLVLQLLTDIRVALFDRLSATGQQIRGDKSGAQWLSRLTADVDALDTLYLRLIAPTALAGVVTLLLSGLAWVLFSGAIALAVLLVLALALLVATVAVLLRTRRLSARLNDQQETLRGEVIEHLEGYAELLAAGRINDHAHGLMGQAHRLSRAQATVDTRVGWHNAATTLLVNITAVLALWLGFALFESGQVSGPVLVLLPIALLGLGEVYGMLPEAFGKFGATEAAARRLNRDVSSPKSELTSAQHELPEGMAAELNAVDIGHPGYAPLLTHFNLRLAKGEILGVVGDSGSGKSSFADTLAGMLPPLTGTVAALPCAYLTQTTTVFDDTVKANLLLGNPGATDAQLWRILEMVELAGRFANETDGLDTWLGSAGNRLSGGEARRLVLARALLNEAPLVILDEPFTGVDADTRNRIAPQIEHYLEDRTVVCLGHGPEALLATDRVIQL
ncbi:thiol reductant ABC exporter subunit CydC [Marinobacter persicus]|uniref:ATP-binding cassette subfamily C protein CydC n=1 Tax=Marinobacter persicus TaxID=930118 RepID=A0A2S6G3E9_9GAMM|nr:thiol reductant ABC exporter subunit CydC [Marinobacter persicus]PPK50313.1 ATP-binding cassette subfamily C protein CydC [Marinobacter persicus]PPK53161.1 ATP-binding cassette subfamily C protein CydC [Marinobacter persicus]PPK56832.1 ATP-binding cassette subfamily C protein CydC [Marinobacter persicus]